MPGITDALQSASSNMAQLENSLSIIQQNVDNASTPGYARQDIVGGTDNSGVTTESSRNQFAESDVQRQNTLYGFDNQLTTLLGTVQQNFTASGTTGIPNAISNLFSSFSALATNPNDSSARQQVIDEAGQLAQNFNSTAANLAGIQSDTRQQISSEVGTINQLAGVVQQYNVDRQTSAADAASPVEDATLNNALEQLSEQANVQAIRQSDGSVTLLLSGQTALVVGENQFPIAANVSGGPNVTIQDSNGNDVTSEITGGNLGASLQVVNQSVPSYEGQLNQLASGVADTVNAQLAAGVDANGNPGAALFTYTAGSAASSLAVTGIATAQVAAASAGSAGGNGNALALSALSTGQTMPGGYTFAAFYGNLAANVGQDVSVATSNLSDQTQLLAQARAQRTAISGVSLDDEAVQLVEFQRAYEAVAKLVNVLDQVSDDTINMIPTA